jgi:hypothetical protein
MSTRPRIRTLKPELWQNEKVGDLSHGGRLLFVGLITMADDEGRFRARPSVILGHVFPYDDEAPKRLAGWMKEVEGEGLVRFYESAGKPYGILPGFTEHQRINRATDSRLPPPRITTRSVNGGGGAS